MGLKLPGSGGSFFSTGVILASLRLSGKDPVEKHLLIISVRGAVSVAAAAFINLLGILSNPDDGLGGTDFMWHQVSSLVIGLRLNLSVFLSVLHKNSSKLDSVFSCLIFLIAADL
jgi:hypothetical protein